MLHLTAIVSTNITQTKILRIECPGELFACMLGGFHHLTKGPDGVKPISIRDLSTNNDRTISPQTKNLDVRGFDSSMF